MTVQRSMDFHFHHFKILLETLKNLKLQLYFKIEPC